MSATAKTMLNIKVNNWWESRAARMLLVALLLIVFAILLRAIGIDEKAHPTLVGIRGVVSDTLLIIGVTAMLTEAGPFKSYVEERIAALSEVISKPVFEQLTNPHFLHANLTPKYIRELRSASTQALLPANIDVYPEFLAVIDDVVLPLAEVAVWRKEYTFTLIHASDEVNGTRLIRERSIAEWTYVNTAAETQTVLVPIGCECKKVEGIENSQPYCGNSCKVNSVDQKLEVKQTLCGGSIICEILPVEIRIESKSEVKIRIEHSGIIATSEPMTRLTFHQPTTGVRLVYSHPKGFRPELYAFSVGGALETSVTDEHIHEWHHSGVFLPNHGVVLEHHGNTVGC